MTGFGNKKLKKIIKDAKTDSIKTQIISKAFLLHSKGNILEAERYYRYCIEQKINDYRIFSNYGLILKNQGKLREAELLLKKTIQLNPNWSVGHNNLGTIQKDLGKLQEAEISFLEAIKLKPDYVDAYYNLGSILSNLGKSREVRLCSEKIMSTRSWSILGSYVSNREMELD